MEQVASDRRSKEVTPVSLNISQKVGLYSLQKIGYSVAFIRQTALGSLAFAFCGDTFVTINEDGDVNYSPTEVIRPL